MTNRLIISHMLLAVCLLSLPAFAEENEVWWQSALNEAERDGYGLIDTESLSDIIARGDKLVILDARADYEFEAGHIPGSVNLEFDLGDRIGLSPEKQQALQDVVGADHKQLLVIYCRSFRWLRSGIAARWAARMGYERVLRYAGGFHSWKETFPKRVDGDEEKKRILAVGDTFPDCRVAVLNGDEDRDYLGLPEDARWLSLSDLTAEFVLIQLYNTMCHDCVNETKLMTRFFERVEADTELSGKLKIIGLGIYDSNADVVRFKRHYDVLYPLFSDKHGQIFECLGQAQLPLAYLLKSNGDGTWGIELIRRGYFEPDDKFLQTLKSAVSRTDGAD